MEALASAMPPLQTVIALLAGGAGAALALKLVWGVSQWGRKSPHRIGAPTNGALAHIAEWAGGEGLVFVDGEQWRATGPASLTPGDDVKIVRAAGLTLEVRKK